MNWFGIYAKVSLASANFFPYPLNSSILIKSTMSLSQIWSLFGDFNFIVSESKYYRSLNGFLSSSSDTYPTPPNTIDRGKVEALTTLSIVSS